MASDSGQLESGRQDLPRQSLPRGKLQKFRRIGRREGFDFSPGASVVSNEWFVVLARKNRIGASRLGVAVAKRISPSACDRNLAKRLVREVFRRAFPARGMGQSCGVNVIVRVRKRLDRKSARDCAYALARLFQGIRAKCGN